MSGSCTNARGQRRITKREDWDGGTREFDCRWFMIHSLDETPPRSLTCLWWLDFRGLCDPQCFHGLCLAPFEFLWCNSFSWCTVLPRSIPDDNEDNIDSDGVCEEEAAVLAGQKALQETSEVGEIREVHRGHSQNWRVHCESYTKSKSNRPGKSNKYWKMNYKERGKGFNAEFSLAKIVRCRKFNQRQADLLPDSYSDVHCVS